MCSGSVMSDSATLWTVCSPAGSCHGTFQARIWSGLPFPTPGDLPDPGVEPASPAVAGGFFTTAPLGKPTGGS